MIKRIVKMTFTPGSEARFRELFDAAAPRIRAFPGCFHLELLRAEGPGNVFFTYSFWADDAALQAYRRSELFADTWAQTRRLFAEKAQAWTLRLEALH